MLVNLNYLTNYVGIKLTYVVNLSYVGLTVQERTLVMNLSKGQRTLDNILSISYKFIFFLKSLYFF